LIYIPDDGHGKLKGMKRMTNIKYLG
jgi:hypothetical protein